MSLILDGTATPAPAPSGDLVKDSDLAGFKADVIDASAQVPVIVDFWAPWCGPCKTLGPALEKAVRQRGGAVRMVKINVDENQELAAQFQVRSIPTVYAFKGGQPVDGFMGALPDSQIAAFVDKLTGGAANLTDEALAQAAALLEAGRAQEAFGLYQQILAEDQANPAALAGVLRCQIALGGEEQARDLLAQLPAQIANHAEVRAVKAALDLAEKAGEGGGGDIAALEARVATDPADHQARLDLALALVGRGAAEEAMTHLLESIRRDRSWNDEAARKQLLEIWDALGPTHPATVAGRRRLSSILFS